MLNKRLISSVTLRNVDENMIDDLEIIINTNMVYIQNYLQETEGILQNLIDTSNLRDKDFDTAIPKKDKEEIKIELERNLNYFNRIFISDKIVDLKYRTLALAVANEIFWVDDNKSKMKYIEDVKKKAMEIQKLWKSVDHKLSEEDIKTTRVFIKTGFLTNDVIATKVLHLKEVSTSEQTCNNADLHNAAILISAGFMTAKDMGQYGYISFSSLFEKSSRNNDNYMGLYKMARVHNKVPYYVQLNSISDDKIYIHLCNNNIWRGGDTLGDEKGELIVLKSQLTTDGGNLMEHFEDNNKVQITISGGDDLPSNLSQYLGQFAPTGQFSAGRQIFVNKHNKYLQVAHGYLGWVVVDTINDDWYKATIRSGCCPSLCPSQTRAKSKPWEFRNTDGEWKVANIKIHCNSLHHGKEVTDLWRKPDHHPSSKVVIAAISLMKQKFMSEDVIHTKANDIQMIWKSANILFTEEHIQTSIAFIESGYLPKDVIEIKGSELKQILSSGQKMENIDFHNAVTLLSKGYMTEQDFGQYGHIMLSSSGESPEYLGSYMGLYKMAGVYNNVPYYVQLNTTSDDKRYIYLSNNNLWLASDKLGVDVCNLLNANTDSSPLLPSDGWKFSKGLSWVIDQKLKLSYVHDIGTVQCNQITISGDDLPSLVVKYLGQFTPTGQFSAGRQIFSNKHNKYLQVVNGYIVWVVMDNINDISTATIQSGCSPSMCPENPRSSYNEHCNFKSWQYKETDGLWKYANIMVKCSSHHDMNSMTA